MDKELIAKASITIKSSTSHVWNALTDPTMIKQYMFGANAISDWKEGSSILWKGEWQGKLFEDKGVILHYEPGQTLQFNHYSPLSGQPDLPENYHTVTIQLSEEGAHTHLTLTQDNNASDQEREHSEQNWNMMLRTLKQLMEKS